MIVFDDDYLNQVEITDFAAELLGVRHEEACQMLAEFAPDEPWYLHQPSYWKGRMEAFAEFAASAKININEKE
jgi:hypothetical protein